MRLCLSFSAIFWQNHADTLSAEDGHFGKKLRECEETTLTSSTIIISVIASLIAAFIYGIFISHKEEIIRRYLKNSREGIIRQGYVNTCISAIRGDAKVGDTSILIYLFIFFLVAVGMYSTFAVKEQRMQLERIVSKYEQVVICNQ